MNHNNLASQFYKNEESFLAENPSLPPPFTDFSFSALLRHTIYKKGSLNQCEHLIGLYLSQITNGVSRADS